MRKTPQAPRVNQQFYLKNLHTESCTSHLRQSPRHRWRTSSSNCRTRWRM